jgi:NitT/TauT family transport system substrate-binding protein
MKKMIANVCVMAGALMLLTGCGSAKESRGEMRVACFPNITHAQALLMKNQKTLETKLGDDYEVSWKTFTAGSSEIEAIFAGEIDIGYIGPVPAVNGNVKSDGDVTVIANAADAGAVLVKGTDSGIESIEDLEGKTVAIPQIGNTQHLCLLNLLSENGLAPVSEGGTVEVVAVENSNLQNMFDQGNVDAALVPEPWGTILTDSGNIDLLLDYQDIYLDGNYPVAVVIVRNEFMEAHPDAVETFLQAHLDATEEINSNLEGSVDAMIAEIESLTGNAYEKETVLSSFARTNVTTELNREALDNFAETSLEQGFISALPKEGFVDTSLVEELSKE